MQQLRRPTPNLHSVEGVIIVMKKSQFLAAALAGVVSATLSIAPIFAADTSSTEPSKATQSDSKNYKSDATQMSKSDKHSCKGKEGCKSTDGVKSHDGCKSKDSCKSGDHCKSKSGCKSKGESKHRGKKIDTSTSHQEVSEKQ